MPGSKCDHFAQAARMADVWAGVLEASARRRGRWSVLRRDEEAGAAALRKFAAELRREGNRPDVRCVLDYSDMLTPVEAVEWTDPTEPGD